MTLVRYNPIRNLTRWNQDIDSMFDSFFGEKNLFARDSGSFMPRVDIVDEKDTVRLEIEMPGMNKEDIKVTVENGVLIISGERTRKSDEKDANYVRCERCYGTFSRSFTLGDDIDSEHISADYKNGILYLTLPKTEKSKPKEIMVAVK
jgi:HSP20 family protein